MPAQRISNPLTRSDTPIKNQMEIMRFDLSLPEDDIQNHEHNANHTGPEYRLLINGNISDRRNGSQSINQVSQLRVRLGFRRQTHHDSHDHANQEGPQRLKHI